MKNRFLQML